jgi:hypothetical protein
MANSNYQNTGYSFGQGPLTTLSPYPIIAKRVPTAADINYALGQLWVVPSVPSSYVLVKVAAGVATWQLNAVGGSGSFTTLTSTGQFNLDTTAVGANTLGNTTGATGISMLVGTGNFSLDGVGASTYRIAPSATTGTITIGGTAQTGTITLGSSTGPNIISIGTGTGATTVNVATGASSPKFVNIGGGAVTNLISIGSTTGGSGLTLLSGSSGISLTGDTSLNGALDVSSPIVANSGTSVIVGGASAIQLGGGLPAPQIIVGSGTPTLAATQGSLYLRTDGSSTSTRLYVNTNNSTGWTNVVTAT